jgi:hypothetical chaperone protein
MRERLIGCGIDFGTSNSAVAVAYEDRVEVVRVDVGATPSLPSVAFLHRDGERQAGAGAAARYFSVAAQRTSCGNCALAPYGISECRHYRRDGGCTDGRLVTGVKRDLGRVRGPATHSWAIDFMLSELAAVVVGTLKREAERRSGQPLERVVLGHPVVFPAAQDGIDGAQELALGQLREAAREAGFREIEFFPEPIAAVMDERLENGWLLSVDFGGGTYDIAVMRVVGGRPEVVGLGGVAVGGENIDEALFESKVGPALGIDSLPNWIANDMRSLAGARRLLMDPGVPGILNRIGGRPARTAAAILYGGFVFDFYKRLEAAKIALSERDGVHVSFHRRGIDLELDVTRAELETMASVELDTVIDSTRDALSAAGVAPDSVRRVLRTGGSSRMPAFGRRVAALCPSAQVEERDAFTGVARGLGVRAAQLWRETVPH